MLISFTLKNWLSFRDETSFSMIASREKQHSQRLPHANKMRLLPVAAIYGGNASGKTNFFKALNFAKNQIVIGTRADNSILTEPFRLDPKYANKPSKFIFTLSIDEIIYEYGFSVTRKTIIEEWLTEFKSQSENNIYYRNSSKNEFGKKNSKGNVVKITDQKLQAIAEGTRNNQLFLTNTIDQNNEIFRHIYNWFRDKLILIAPNTHFGGLEELLLKKHSLSKEINDALSLLDTGITSLNMRKIPFDSLPLTEKGREDIRNEVKENNKCKLLSPNNDRFLISMKDDSLIAYKLISFHSGSNQQKVEFPLRDESAGTLRIIDLLPAFKLISQPESNIVFVIDELDRSLHTLLTRQLLKIYLDSCNKNSKSQLIFTTHDLLLMDQELFRRDEMWLIERDQNGASGTIPLSDYKEIRYDKDILKSYLLGVLGGIPRILIQEQFANG
ncbi:MAG: ATP-binding protein [Gammaproteobacteria bacterium]|jgi:AAA15 family ATPase/GTPase